VFISHTPKHLDSVGKEYEKESLKQRWEDELPCVITCLIDCTGFLPDMRLNGVQVGYLA